MIVGPFSELTLSVVGSFLISAILWGVLWVLFGRRIHPAIGVVIVTALVFIVGIFFNLTAGISLVFTLALTAILNPSASVLSLFAFSAILAAVGIIAISVAVIAVLVSDAVERATEK